MDGDWKRLAEYAARRRAELGLSQGEVAHRGPLSLDRVQNIEGAKRTRYRLATLLALERALQWRGGSIDAILSGGEPVPLGQTVPVGVAVETDTAPAVSPHKSDSPVEAQMLREINERLKADPELARMFLEILRRRGRPPQPGESGDGEDQQRDAG